MKELEKLAKYILILLILVFGGLWLAHQLVGFIIASELQHA